MTDVLNLGEDISAEIDGEVAILTIMREDRRNALDHNAVKGLREGLAQIAETDSKAIVLTGQGTKSFCAGDDVKAYNDRTADQSWQHFQNGLRLMDEIATHPCLVIAAIEGYCFGGGLELALSCDHRIASEAAQFALPEVRKLKANPTWGGMTRLPQLIGLNFARRLALMGERWDAATAHQHGLVDAIVPSGEARASALEAATGFAADVERRVVARTKAILNASAGTQMSSMHLMNLLCEGAQPFEG